MFSRVFGVFVGFSRDMRCLKGVFRAGLES